MIGIAQVIAVGCGTVDDMAEATPTSQELRLTSPLLGYLERQIRVEAESELAAFGLRPRHVIALTVLRQIGEGTQADLATAL